MTKISKLFSMLCAAALAAVMLAACSGDTSSQAPSSAAPSEPASVAAPSSSTPEPASEPSGGTEPGVTAGGGEQSATTDMDYLVYNGFMYMRADTYPGVEGLDVSTLTKGAEVMKVLSNADTDTKTDGYASVIPEGAAVHAVEGDPSLLIASAGSEDIAYIMVMAVE